jgi:hypothetical protein
LLEGMGLLALVVVIMAVIGVAGFPRLVWWFGVVVAALWGSFAAFFGLMVGLSPVAAVVGLVLYGLPGVAVILLLARWIAWESRKFSDKTRR